MSEIVTPQAPRRKSQIGFVDGLDRLVHESDALTDRMVELAKDVRVTLAIATLAGDPIQEQRGLLTK